MHRAATSLACCAALMAPLCNAAESSLGMDGNNKNGGGWGALMYKSLKGSPAGRVVH